MLQYGHEDKTEARRVRFSGARTYLKGAWLTCAVLAFAGVGFAYRQAPHQFAFAQTKSEAVCALPSAAQQPLVPGPRVLEVGSQAFAREISGLVLVLPSCDTCGKAPLFLRAVERLSLAKRTLVFPQDSGVENSALKNFRGSIENSSGDDYGAGFVLVDSGRILKIERDPVLFYDFAKSIGEAK